MQSLPSFDRRMSVPTLPAVSSSTRSAPLSDIHPTPSTESPTILGVPSNKSALPPIMIADDDADDRFLIQRLVTRTGAANPIITFDDGTEVVNYLGGVAAAHGAAPHHPSLLFLDLRMTGLGGFEFLEWARQRKNALSLTIVVLSNSAEPADVSRAMSLGAHRYLVKYPSIQTFTTIIRSVYPFTLAR